jgi:hypothetical protein
MAEKNHPAWFEVQGDVQGDLNGDLRTDYALIAAGVGAALLAFVYLLLT